MRRILLPLAALSTAVLLAAGARGQSGRKVQTIDLRPLSCVVLVSVEEYSEGRVVKGREFKYPIYFTDDGRPATLSPIISAVRLKSARVSYLDRIVTSDPYADLVWRLDGDDPELEVIPVYAVSDPRTGLPDHKTGSKTLGRRDKNGRETVLLLNVRYRDWRKRAVTVTELPDDEP